MYIISYTDGPESISLTPSVTSRTIDEGDDLGSIECNAACYPECTYVWRKQYQNNTVSRNNVLTIGNNVRREKAGRYTCTATNANRAGSPTDTTTFDVFIRCKS